MASETIRSHSMTTDTGELRCRARPLAAYDPATAPYDPVYYLGKIDDWLERYGRFLGIQPQAAQQEMNL